MRGFSTAQGIGTPNSHLIQGSNVYMLLRLAFLILSPHKIRLKCQVPLYSCQDSSWHLNGVRLNGKMFSLESRLPAFPAAFPIRVFSKQ